MSNQLDKSKICAVIVTFHPDSKFPLRLNNILAQVDSVVIVDNDSNPTALAMLEQIVDSKRTFLISNKANLGIAKALNQAISWAVTRQCNWIWSFDQDTDVPAGALDRLIDFYNSRDEQAKIGILAPNYFDINCKSYYISPNISAYPQAVEIPSAINSGSLMDVHILQQLGGFEEKFFIDCVDYEYCLRLRYNGFKIFLLRDVIINHEFGKAANHRFFHKMVTVGHHSAQRRYYWSRNGFSLLFRYIFKSPKLGYEIFKAIVKSLIVILLFEKPRFLKGKFLALGIYDAVFQNFRRNF